jgi:hypothetical protein
MPQKINKTITILPFLAPGIVFSFLNRNKKAGGINKQGTISRSGTLSGSEGSNDGFYKKEPDMQDRLLPTVPACIMAQNAKTHTNLTLGAQRIRFSITACKTHGTLHLYICTPPYATYFCSFPFNSTKLVVNMYDESQCCGSRSNRIRTFSGTVNLPPRSGFD